MARGKKVAQGLTPEEKLAQALVPVEEQPYPIPENWCWAYLDKIYCVNPKNDVEEDADAAFIPMEKISAGMQNDYTFEIQPWKKAKKAIRSLQMEMLLLQKYRRVLKIENPW